MELKLQITEKMKKMNSPENERNLEKLRMLLEYFENNLADKKQNSFDEKIREKIQQLAFSERKIMMGGL